MGVFVGVKVDIVVCGWKVEGRVRLVCGVSRLKDHAVMLRKIDREGQISALYVESRMSWQGKAVLFIFTPPS